jgi:NADH:ubiquinone oxidoreductase subunit 6 (subunit J)
MPMTRALIWWAKCRAVLPTIVVTVLLSAFLALTGDTPVQVPSIIGAIGVTVPLGYFFPLPVIVAVGVGLSRPDRLTERRSARPVRIWDLAFGVLLVALLLAAAAVGPGEAPLIAARNTAAGIGLTLLAGRFLPASLASLPAVAWILIGVLTGRTEYGQDAVWNWPILEAPSAIGWAWAAVLMTAGAIAHLVPR